jgi:M6 family metalloprotease-like protein
MVVVRFPDITPTTPIEMVKRKVVSAFNMYVVEQSYGLASVNADFRGYVTLPSPLSQYKVSQFNNQVDAGRVRKLIEDTMTILEKEVDFSSYDHILIIPAVRTTAGTGYGMVCYCANPGMLTAIQKSDRFRSIGRVGQYETLRSKGGKQFKGGVFVGAENANLGMFAHDYFHALGGIYEGRRFAP